jgi:hypothetical protein
MLTLEKLADCHRPWLEPIIGSNGFAPQPDTDRRAMMVDGECVGLVLKQANS